MLPRMAPQSQRTVIAVFKEGLSLSLTPSNLYIISPLQGTLLTFASAHITRTSILVWALTVTAAGRKVCAGCGGQFSLLGIDIYLSVQPLTLLFELQGDGLGFFRPRHAVFLDLLI